MPVPAGPRPAVRSRRARTEAAKAVRGAARDAGSNRTLAEPVDTRALPIDSCASCPDVHVRAAVKGGESPQCVAVLPACRDTGLFAPDERAAVVLAASPIALPTPCPGPGPAPGSRRSRPAPGTRAGLGRGLGRHHHPYRQSRAGRQPSARAEPSGRRTACGPPREPAGGSRMTTTVRDNPEQRRYEIHDGQAPAGFPAHRITGRKTTARDPEAYGGPRTRGRAAPLRPPRDGDDVTTTRRRSNHSPPGAPAARDPCSGRRPAPHHRSGGTYGDSETARWQR